MVFASFVRLEMLNAAVLYNDALSANNYYLFFEMRYILKPH